jgi:hypothetical protein
MRPSRGKDVVMLDELEWVRRELDRLVMTRLMTRLDRELEVAYERLCCRERQLMAARNAALN